MRRPLPVMLLTGFLGAGKTTLLRHLLAAPHGLQIGVVLNEFGQAGIDVPPDAQRAYLEIAEGCACCVRNDDLQQALAELCARGDLDLAIIETSGLADPLPMTWSIERPELRGDVRLDSVIAVVDACNLERARSDEWEAQVRGADLVVLTKRDLATPEQLAAAESAVKSINTHARILAPGADLPVELLLDVELPPVPRPRGQERPSGRHSAFGGVLLNGGRYALHPLEDLLESLPDEVFRAKGIVPVEDARWVAFHAVGGRVQVDLQAPRPAHGEARIVLFGRSLDEAALRSAFARCETPVA